MPSGPRPRIPALLPLLFGAILLLASVLAYEAVTALREREAAAARTLRDYATIASWELVTRTSDLMSQGVRELLDPVAASPASSPYDPLPALPAVQARLDSLFPCGDSVASPPALFRLDLRDGGLQLQGDLAPGLRRWLADTIDRDARQLLRPDQRHAVIDRVPGRPELVLVYAARRAQYGAFAQPGAPIAAFGFLHCRAGFGWPLMQRVMAGAPLLPTPVSGGLPNDSLLQIVRLPDGTPPGDAEQLELAHIVTLETPAAYRIRVGLRNEALARLAILAPGNALRLPWLIGLLVVAAGFVAVALLQLRREQELTRLRSDFTSSVSHELRTPLAQILLSGETLALGRVRGEQQEQQMAGVIVTEARRLIRMVENVLRFAQLERGVHQVDPRPARLAPLLRAVLTPWLAMMDGRVRIVTNLDEQASGVIDADAITQVLHNLLDNAVKYGPDGQTITVSLEQADGQVRIGVEDEGPGVPEELRSRIWNSFVRGNTAEHRAAGGTGLGLAVVRELIVAQGGKVAVEDGTKGARFVVELPAVGA
jgi:signal transduction histidine kinase